MTLDPDVERLLASLTVPTPRRDGTFDLEEMRRAMAATAAGAPRVDIGGVDDATIPGGDGQALPIRVYQAAQPASSVAALFFHGGGWAAGGLDTHDAFVRSLTAASGVTFIAVDYRLAPEHPFPAAVDDCFAATAWVAAHASDLGLDRDLTRLAVVGDSAGANLAAVVTLVARERGGPSIAFQALLCPGVDMDTGRWASMHENGHGYLVTREMLEWYFDMYVDTTRRRDPRVSPIHAEDLSRLPPAFVLTAEYDPLRDEGEAYARRLADAGVPVELARYDGQVHGFIRMDGAIERAAAAQARIATVIRKALTQGRDAESVSP
jgi:acetyl esterase/lipase